MLMNYKDINYETIEERNLRRMKSLNDRNCHHSFIVHRVMDIPNPYYIWTGKIHLRCEKCGKVKKLYVNKATLLFYNKGDKWSGKKGK
jgi:hypothetical protein